MFTLLEELLCAGHLRITGRAPESGTQAPLFCTLLALSCKVLARNRLRRQSLFNSIFLDKTS